MKADIHTIMTYGEFDNIEKVHNSLNYTGRSECFVTDTEVSHPVLSKAGFTILELIVSITILTLVALVIGQGFRIGVNAWDKGEAETVETQKLRILSGMLTQQLKSFYNYRIQLEDESGDKILFEGEKESILFVTTLTEVSAGGLKWVRYSYKEGVLYYNEGLLPDKEVMGIIEDDEEILDDDIGEVFFEYYSSHEEEWKDSWDTEDAVPDSVRVKISYFEPFQVNFVQGTSVRKEKAEG